MKTGDRVQVFDETRHVCLGWGTIVQIARNTHTDEDVPLIMLEGKSQRKIWGDRCAWIPEKKAAEIGVRLFQDMMRGGEK